MLQTRRSVSLFVVVVVIIRLTSIIISQEDSIIISQEDSVTNVKQISLQKGLDVEFKHFSNNLYVCFVEKHCALCTTIGYFINIYINIYDK